MKKLLKKLSPSFLIDWYHKCLAYLAMFWYGNPSNKLIVIGVTGTNGKSTTVNLIGKILEQTAKVGWASTANYKIAEKEWLNDTKMTMLGRMQTQKLLSEMVKAGCKYAIIETSSEGIKQYRHVGINYDVAVFTNLTPEHLEAHGGFENYKKAKTKLFEHLTKKSYKVINGQKVLKTIIANLDDANVADFLNFPADRKITFSLNKPSDLKAEEIQISANGSSFSVNGYSFSINLISEVNIYNALAAIAVAKSQNISNEISEKALADFKNMPGRFEWIEEEPADAKAMAGRQNFKVMVDYAPEPGSMKVLYETLKLFKFNNIIHVLGSCGGGRDKARRPVLGKMAAENAQVVIITNEDPYDDDPMEIINNVAEGAKEAGKILNQNLFKIEDRREAIAKALALAQEGDLVLITGKGSEQFICVANGKKIPWDDRKAARELLNTHE